MVNGIPDLPEIDFNTLDTKSLRELDGLSYELQKGKDAYWQILGELKEIKYGLIDTKLTAEIAKQDTKPIKAEINKLNRKLGHISIQMGRIRNAERILHDKKMQILRPS